jgi:hypothetical protein
MDRQAVRDQPQLIAFDLYNIFSLGFVWESQLNFVELKRKEEIGINFVEVGTCIYTRRYTRR